MTSVGLVMPRNQPRRGHKIRWSPCAAPYQPGCWPGYASYDVAGGLFSRRSCATSFPHHVLPEPSPASCRLASRRTGTFQGQLFHPRFASASRDGPRAHRLPVQAMACSTHSITPLRGALAWETSFESMNFGESSSIVRDIPASCLLTMAKVE